MVKGLVRKRVVVHRLEACDQRQEKCEVGWREFWSTSLRST